MHGKVLLEVASCTERSYYRQPMRMLDISDVGDVSSLTSAIKTQPLALKWIHSKVPPIRGRDLNGSGPMRVDQSECLGSGKQGKNHRDPTPR